MDDMTPAVSEVITVLLDKGMKRGRAMATAPEMLAQVRVATEISPDDAARVIKVVLDFADRQGMINRPFTGAERRALSHDEPSIAEMRYTLREEDDEGDPE